MAEIQNRTHLYIQGQNICVNGNFAEGGATSSSQPWITTSYQYWTIPVIYVGATQTITKT